MLNGMLPTSLQIAQILPHVRYEIEQSFSVPKHDQNDPHVRESVYLAMLVHARLLLDFFEHKTRERDSVLCSDFGFPSSKISLAKKDRERLNKDIAHLTYARLRHTPQTKPWPLLGILRPLRSRVESFVKHIVNSPPIGSAADEISAWAALSKAFTKPVN